MIFLFSNKKELSLDDAILIDKIAPEAVHRYNLIMKDVALQNSFTGLDLILRVMSRNPFHSDVLDSITKLLLLELKLKNKERITKIILDKKELIGPVNSILVEHKLEHKIEIEIESQDLSIFFSSLKNFLGAIYFLFSSFIWSFFLKKSNLKEKNDIVILDTFIQKSNFDNECEFKDRYYPGFQLFLEDKNIDDIFIVPTIFDIFSIKELIRIAKCANKSKLNFLFQEQFFNLKDYISILVDSIKIPLKFKKINYSGSYNLEELLRKEVRRDYFSPSLCIALSKYYFFKSLKRQSIIVKKVINWHENQDIDKSMCYALNFFYPATKVIGYQGSIPSLYETHRIPEEYEYKLNVLPKEIYVVTETQREFMQKRCNQLYLKVGPSFRFSYLKNIIRKEVRDKKILIALPMNVNESINILKMVQSMNKNSIKNIKLLYKIHPALATNFFYSSIEDDLLDDIEETKDDIESLLSEVSMVISSASSVCIEAASLDIPTAIYGNRYGVTLNPVSEKRNHISKIIYCSKQLEVYINANISRLSQKKQKIFVMPNKENTMKLFG